MQSGDEMRISYTNKDNIKKVHVINLPEKFNELKETCFDYFGIKNEDEKKQIYFFAKIAGNPDLCLQESNYLKNKEDEESFTYEIELKNYIPKEKGSKNPNDYLLAKKEDENLNVKVMKEKKEHYFFFTLVNKGNYTWDPPFKVSNEKIDTKVDNKGNLTCTTYIVYQPVHPNDEIKCKVNVLELNKKNRDSVLKIRLFKSDKSNNSKYPENSVEFKFTILPAEEFCN